MLGALIFLGTSLATTSLTTTANLFHRFGTTRTALLLVALLRLLNNLLEAVTLLVRALRLHRLHRALNVSQPLIRHYEYIYIRDFIP